MNGDRAKSPIGPANAFEFCEAVELVVKQQYGLDDGADLCWNLLENGTIGKTASLEEAARVVAQHLQQQ